MARRSLAPAGYISTEEASLRSGYTINHFAELARTGRLRARFLSGRWFIDEQALETFLTNRETRPKRGRPSKSMRSV
jgi:hypothetical protein